MNLLEGKTAIITGGTRGIGFGIAKKFLENGANVAVCGSRQSSVDKALAEFAELGYTDAVMGIVPDLSDPASIDAEFAKVVERFGRLDILGNNAGMSSRTPMADYTAEEFRKVMELNVDAVLLQPGGREDLPCPGQRRLDREHLVDGGQARPAVGRCLPHLQVRRERPDPLARPGARPRRHPRERRGPRRDPHRHGSTPCPTR